jgi:cellulose biosynthesis protein BcsQ
MFELKQKTATGNVVPENKKNKVLIIDLDTNENISRLILLRVEGDKTPGVLVDYIDKDSKFVNILKEGDRLLYVNGLLCVNTRDAVDVINHTYRHRGILKI